MYVQITVLVLKGTSNKTIKRVNLQSFVCSELDGKSAPPAYMVYAGLEPLAFTNLFPFWTCEESVREINLRVNGIFFLCENMDVCEVNSKFSVCDVEYCAHVFI